MEFHTMGNFMRGVQLRSVSLTGSSQKVSREGKQSNKRTRRDPLRPVRVLSSGNSVGDAGCSIALLCLLPCGNVAFSIFFDDALLVSHVL